ncbi:hypothetical protein HLB23_10110 [Nocardia uniformis]|uniref:Uncharacterized protein n=1 Tax=Nocardia uniformis TaxID=53432 RepID=A0A849CB70_9NOCA|nr:DUF6463 family protein [Nocardia uniformis]NNH70211.1 hypothetical protein [Nocardia uniformis]
MNLTEQRTSAEPGSVRATRTAGWIAVVFGVVHTVLAPLQAGDTWSQAVSDGWWNTFTLEKAITPAQLERSESFWISLGSFGVPVLILGCYVVWSTRQRHRVPAWIGWIVLAWALIMATAVPVSPAWVLIVCGGLIVFGDRHSGPDRVVASGEGATFQ